MKAIIYTKYGSPDVLQLKEVQKPVPQDNEVLIKVYATTVNRTDCATIRAKPFFMRIVTGLFKPKKQIPGTEFAGEIEAVGKSVSSLNVGDKVFGFDDQGSIAGSKNESNIELDFNNEQFVQMDAVTDDHGVYDEPMDYYKTSKYRNRPNTLTLFIYKMFIGGVNNRVKKMRFSD